MGLENKSGGYEMKKELKLDRYYIFGILILILSFVVMIVLINLNIHILSFVSLLIGVLLSLHFYNFGKGAKIIKDLLRTEEIDLESFSLLKFSFTLIRNNRKYEIVVFPSIDFYTLFDQIAGIDNTFKESVGRRYIPSHLQIRVQIEGIDRYEVLENLIAAMYNIKKSSYPFFQTRPASKIGEAIYSRVQGLEKDVSISDKVLHITLLKVSGNVYLVAFLHKYSVSDDFLGSFEFLEKIEKMLI